MNDTIRSAVSTLGNLGTLVHSSRRFAVGAAMAAAAWLAGSAQAGPITPGNLVVVRMGDGVLALPSTGTAVFLDEYTPAGALVQTIALPTTTAGSQRRLVLSGTATSEGFLTQSADGRYLILGGYDAALLATAPPTSSTNRVIARVDLSGGIDTTTAITATTPGSGNLRSATSIDGSAYWISTSGAGLVYTGFGGGAIAPVVSSTFTNLRVAQVAGGQLYVSSAASTLFGLGSVGSGAPTASAQVTAVLSGFPTASGPSSYDFWFASPTVVYVADDRATPSGGIQKWTLSGSTWSLAYTMNSGLTGGCRGLSGFINASGQAVLYATTAETTQRIVTVTDAGATSAYSAVVTTPGTNRAFRGIRLVRSVSPVIDGMSDPLAYGAALSVQAAPTLFGDETGGSTSCANAGSELNQAFGRIDSGSLYLQLPGNLQTNGNRLILFVDSTSGGQNALRGDITNGGGGELSRLGANGGDLNNGGPGLTFDTGFAPDYAVVLNGTCSGPFALFADLFTLPTSAAGTKVFLGSTTVAAGDGTLSGGTNPNNIRATIDNSNIGGVTGVSAANATNASKGVELVIPLSAIGSPSGDVRVCALIASDTYQGTSNQVLGSLGAASTNYTNGSFRNFQTDADAAGNQFFTVQQCTPPSIGSQPPTQIVQCAGATTMVSVTAAGSGLGYQWQQSTNGGSTWANVSTGTGGTTATYTTSSSAADFTQFRCVVTGSCGVVTSAAATLRVASQPPVGLTASPASVLPGQPVTLSATPVFGGDSVEWYTGSCLGTFVGSGSSIVVNPPFTTTYFARSTSVSPSCLGASCASVTVVVNSFSPVVISQVYSRGNQASPLSSYNRSYIELYNRSSSPVGLGSYSLQVTTTGAGTAWTRLNLVGSIGGNGYLLIAMSPTDGANGAALPMPELTFSPAVTLSTTDGKVALVSNQVTLTGACPVPGSGGIVDLVGWGPLASCWEGAAPAPTNGANTAATLRLGGGTQDTDNNSADFSTGTPNPRNTTSPPGSTTALGACCLSDGTCAVLSAAACGTAGGSYGGDNTVCPFAGYAVTTRNAALASIVGGAGTTTIPITGDDTTSAAITLPFTFTYFGAPRTSFVACTNGWMSLTTTTSTAFSNVSFPNTAAPNDLIAAYWDDLNVTAPGAVYYQTQGSAPNRRLVVEWNQVITRNGAAPGNTFQVILYETSNAIEFRYGTIVPQGGATGTATASFSTGIENIVGTVGYDVNPASLGSGGAAAARLFAPAASGCTPATGACCVVGNPCQALTALNCQLAGGSFQGGGTTCSPDPCAFGACCLTSGSCTDMTPGACATAGGLYQGDNTTCGTTTCPPTGACCVGGTCSINFQTQCDALTGVWTGGGTCSPISPCLGACCDGATCTLTTLAGCSFTFQGLSTTCTPVSFCLARCCFTDGSCQVLASSACTTAGGTPGAAGSTCGTITYAVTSLTNTVEDISGVATAGPTGDDAASANITLPFPFYYFGELKTQVGYSTNGLVQFTTGATLASTAFTNPTTPAGGIPNSAAPNDIIAAVWDDLVVDGPGLTRHAILGTAPLRRLVIEWSQVREITSGNRLTFQAVLFEGSNAIEYRYQTYFNETTTDDYTIGVENLAGNAGLGLLAAQKALIANGASRLFAPAGMVCPQATGACCVGINCGVVTYADCQIAGGGYQGHNTTCAVNPCTPPGACCTASGSCSFTTAAACGAVVGNYFIGEGVACSPTACPTGACCLVSGTCVVNIQLDCTAQTGTSWTAEGTCAPNLCVGRCCLNDGTCAVTTPANCAGSYGGGGTTCAGPPSGIPQTFAATSPDVPLVITDNTPAGVNSTITVAPSFVVGKATVFVEIPAHTYIGDLIVKLTKGTTTVTLFSRACGTQEGLTATFDDAGSLTQVCAFPQGTIRPATFAGGSLSSFNGLNSDGVWTLNVSDNAGSDTGTLVAWSLILDPAVSPCLGACCVAGTCQQLSVDACAAASGSYKGAGTLCSAQTAPAAPTGVSVDQPSYCANAAPATISLTAACASGDTIQWFTDSCGGTAVGTGSPLVISAPLASTTYYARCYSDCGLASGCTTVDVTVLPVPTPPTGAAADTSGYCSNAAPAMVTLTASGGSGLTLHWYAGSCGGASIGTGSPLVIAAPATTTTYHAQWTTGCGASTCATVTVNVTPAPTVDAGVAADACAPATVALSGSGTNAVSYLWTGGAGSFADATSPVTTYTPGPTETGSVTLTLTATGNEPCIPASDTVSFNVGQPPTALAGPSLTVTGCTAFPVALSGSVSNAASSLWTTTGSGTFADATNPVTTYTVSPADVTAGTVTLTLTAQPNAPCTVPASSVLTLTVLPPLTTAYVDDDYTGLPNGTAVTHPAVGGSGSYIIGCNAFASIQAALNAVTGSTVIVAPGTYDEDLSIAVNNTNLVGSGAAVTIIRGVPTGHPNDIGSATIQVIGKSGVTISGLTITRLGNAAATWNDPLNNNGLLASSSPGLTVRDCIITGNRNGVNLQFMDNATVRNNVIDFNRTGMQCVDNVTNSTFTQNAITNNWTIGVLFRDETTGGSDTTGTVFTNNNISGNWYAQVEYRNPDAHPVTLKNFSGNWLGTVTPTQQPSNGGEPSYVDQIPASFPGGTATAPGPMALGVADIKGDAIANFDITPMLASGTDTDISTGFGTFGFQGGFAALSVTATLAQTGTTGRVQEGHDTTVVGGTVSVQAGAYSELVRITQPVSLLGAQSGVCAQGGAARGAESVLRPPAGASALYDVLVYLDSDDVTIDGFTLDGDNLVAGGQPSGAEFTDVGNLISNSSFEDDLAYPFVHVKSVTIRNNILRNVNDVAVQIYNDGSDPVSDGNVIACNDFNNIGGDNVIGTGGPYDRIGVLIYNDTYAQIDDNSLRGCNIGVQTGNNFRANGGPAAGMSDNQLSMVETVGLWHNLHYAAASPWSIAGNTIVGLGAANSAGIFVTSLYNGATASVSNNTVSDFVVGLEFWNNQAVPAVSVTGGTVSDCGSGVRFYNSWAGGYGDADSSTLWISGASLVNNDSGLVIVDTPGDDPGAPVRGTLTVEASGLSATGNANDGVSVSGVRAGLFLHDSLTSITGNAVGVRVDAGAARIQTTNLTGNSAAGVAVTSGGVADLGQCSPGADVTGLGISTGGNNLSGYGFDGAAPHAIANTNSSSQSDVFAAGNNFGAGANDNIALALSGNGGGNSDILFDQPGSPLFATEPSGGAGCVGGSFTFTALAYNITGYQWYKDAAPLGGETGPSLTINPLTLASAGSYTVEITDLCGNTTTSAPAVLAVNPQPVAPSGAGVDSSGYCANAAPATITLTAAGGSGDTLEWFSGSCGGTPVGTGSPLVVAAPGLTTTYFARWTNTCGSSACASVTVNVTPDAAAPTAASSNVGSFCADSAPANISLSASGGSGDTLEWFSGSCGGTPIGTGSPLVIAAPGATTSYFARWTGTCGSSACASVTVTVQAAPTASAGGPYSVTGQTPVAISGTASDHASVLWSTSGTGVFANAAALSTTYTPSAADETAGSVTLTLTANPVAPCATAAVSNASLTITPCVTGSVVYVDDGYAMLAFGTAVNFPHDGNPGPHIIGCNAFATIQGAINAVVAPGTVNVAAGSYNEDVSISKTVSVVGAGAGSSVVSGPIGGGGATFAFGAENVVLAGFTITRDGNNTTDWNAALNSAGVAIQGRASGTVRDCLITGNRTGIDINNSSNITVRNSVIDFNRTGLLLRNTTDNLTVTQNAITNNWTVGVLFLDATNGASNTPLQQALGGGFTNNTLTGNWYGQIVDRQASIHIPAPGTTNLKNFSGNWLGTTTPVISTANSAEPGYAAQIPVAFGGTAVPPGGQPDVLGPASANFDITPMLASGTDTDVSTGFGVFGFQGDYSALAVTAQLAQTGSTGRVQEGHDAVSVGGTVAVEAGTFTENVVITKHLTIDGAGSGDCASGADPMTQSVLTAANTALPTVTLSDAGGASAMDRLTLRDLRITGSTVAGVQATSTAVRSYFLFDNLAIAGNGGAGLEFVGTSGFADVQVLASSFCSNYIGIRTATSLASFDGLSVDGCEVRNSTFNGLAMHGLTASGFNPTNITVSNSQFSSNGQSSNLFQGSGDLSFFEFNGNATITNVTIATTGRVPVQFRGRGLASPGTWLPAGMVAINGLTVTGTADRPAMYIHFYNDVTGFSLNNVDLTGVTSSAPPNTAFSVAGMILDHTGAAPFQLGNTAFPCPGGGYAALAVYNTGGARATCSTTFAGATTLAQKEACVVDADDPFGLPGQVTFDDVLIASPPMGGSVCAGGMFTFTVSASGLGPISYQWRRDGNPVGTDSNSYTIASATLADSGSYTVDVSNACGTVTTAAVSFTVYANPVAPSAAAASSTSYCLGDVSSITLSATGGSGETLQWFDDSCGGTIIGTGSPLVIAAPAVTTTYHARWLTTNCGASTCASVTVTVNAVPASPAMANASPNQLCDGGNVTLSASVTGANVTVDWYAGSCGGTPVGSGASIVVSVGSTTTYYARARNTLTGCESAACDSTTVTVLPSPVAPSSAGVSDPSYCAGSVATITLTATGGSGDTLGWYRDSCGGVAVGTGSPLVIAAPSASTTYFARWETASCGNSACASVAVSVQAAPTVNAGGPYLICANGVAALSGVAGNAASVLWTTSGSGVFSDPTSATAVYTPSPADISAGSVVLTLTAQAIAPCTGSVNSMATLTIQPLPVAPTSASVNNNNFCAGAFANITLTAAGGSGAKLTWHKDSCGGTIVGNGTPLVIAAPSATTTYFARWINPCGTSTCASVTVTVYPNPLAPSSVTVSQNTWCSGSGPANLTLNALGGSGDTFEWFTGSCGGTAIGTGVSLVVPTPTSSTTYFGRWTTVNCGSSACASVAVTVNPLPVAPTSASVDAPAYCEDSEPANITLTAAGGSGDTLRWYSGSCGGVAVGTGSPLVIAAPLTTTTYFARWETTTCGASACASVAVTVNPLPVAPTGITSSHDNFCSTSVANITLTSVGGSGDTLRWFDDSCGGNLIGTGSPLNIAAPLTTTTYYARWTNGCGDSTCASLTVTVTPIVGACCSGYGVGKNCNVVPPASCAPTVTPAGAYRGDCTTCTPVACCPADYNNNGIVSVQDIFDFLAAYFAGSFEADFNNNTFISVQDIFDYLAAYFSGC